MSKMNTINAKKIVAALLAASTAFSVFGATVTFEDASSAEAWSGWNCVDEKTGIVSNPYKCGNTSDNCFCISSSGWGMQGYRCEEDLSKKYVAVDVYTTEECVVKCCSKASDQDLYLDAVKSKWTTLYFDFTSYNASKSAMLYIGPSSSASGTIYIDNVRYVTDKSDAVSCSEALVSEVCKNIADYTYGTLAVGGGGFVPGIIASGNTKIARTDVGGAYKWRASDCSWQPITNFISEANKGLYSIEAVAIDPSNEQNIYLLGGCQYLSSQKTAVMFSKDGGKTFTTSDVSSLIYVHGNGDGRNCGERIAVDPNNSNIVYCGGRVRTPLIKSEDGGANWTAVSSFPSVYKNSVKWPSWEAATYATTSDENGVTAVVFDGSSKSGGKTQRIFVGVSELNTSNVYVSEDGGSSWSAVGALPTNYIPCRMKMDPAGNLLIAYSDKKAYGSNGAIYRYNPTTKKAENISPATGFAFGDVAVSPKDANKLVVSTNSTWVSQNWDNGSKANGDIFWTSTDGGKNWRKLQDNFTITNNGVSWIPGYAIHWCGTVCFDPQDDNKVSFGSGNGIFTCNNIWCDKTPTFYFDVNGLEETVALDLVSVPGGDVLSVIGDYTGFIHKDIHSFAQIHDPAPGTTGGINYYSKDTKVMMRVANTGFYYTTSGYNGWKKMSASTTYSYTNPYYSGAAAQAANEGKCAITKKNGTYRYFVIPGPGESGIFYSDNNGSSWTKISGTDNATHIQVDPENDAYVYAGGKGYFYASSDYGTTFTSSSMSNNDYGRIAVVSGVEGLVYAPCGGNGLMVSTDYGKTFTKVSNVGACEAVGVGAGNEFAYSIYIYGKANDCELGIYRSDDKGATWQRLSTDQQLFGGPGNGAFLIGDWNNYGRFYMSTLGLGIVYGEPTAMAEPSTWNCFVDNSECKITSTAEVKAGNETQVFPNPFFESFTIQGEGDYRVMNSLGQLIEAGTLNGSAELGQGWVSGIYFVSVNGSVQKVIKE